MNTPKPIWKPGLPYPAQEDIPLPEGMLRVIAHDGRKDLLPFLNDCAITAFEDKLYVAWYNSTNTELGGSSLIRGCSSADGGRTWSKAFHVVGEANFDEDHFVPVNLFVHNQRLYAIVTHMGHRSLTGGESSLDLYLMHSENDWEKVAKIAGGLVMTAAPVLMENGCYVAGVWMSKKDETPSFAAVLISQGMEIEKPWRCSFVYDPLLPGALDLRCAEIGITVDGAQITAYVRDDIGHYGDASGGGHAFAFTSLDYGESWSPPVLMDNRVGNAKLYSGKLSNGRRYVVYNEDRGFFDRSLLLLAVTEPGEVEYTKVYKLFEDGLPEFDGRGYRWFYPCTYEYAGRLYVACTMEEADKVRSAAVASVPLEAL